MKEKKQNLFLSFSSLQTRLKFGYSVEKFWVNKLTRNPITGNSGIIITRGEQITVK